VVYEAPATDVRHGVDSMLAAILHLARSCTAHRIVPTAVALRPGPPASVDPYRVFFGVDPVFGAQSSALWFSSDDLARPSRGADPATATALLAHAPALLTPPTQAPFLERVERAILHSLDAGDGSLPRRRVAARRQRSHAPAAPRRPRSDLPGHAAPRGGAGRRWLARQRDADHGGREARRLRIAQLLRTGLRAVARRNSAAVRARLRATSDE
jgi:hypothetical protein